MSAQAKANKTYVERNREKINRLQRKYYQLTKEKQAEQQRIRNIKKREGAYKWYNKIVTGYLNYEQGRRK